jgi:hypothetical protein
VRGAVNLLDVMALVVLAASGMAAALKGWLREAIALAAVLIGLFPALRHCDLPGIPLRRSGLDPLTADIAGALLILILFLAAGSLLSAPLARRWAPEPGVTRRPWLAALLGVIRGYVLVVVAFTLLAAFPAGRLSLRESALSGTFLVAAPAVAVFGGGELGPSLGYGLDILTGPEADAL